MLSDYAIYTDLFIRLAINLVCVALLVHGVFLRLYRRHELAFTFWMLNLVTFSIVHLLAGVQVQMSLSLGLFAVFGILRYRTEAMKIRDLTYLFGIIGLGIVNGVGTLGTALIIDVALLAVALFEFTRREESLVCKYDKPALLAPSSYQEAVQDLSQRLGVNIIRLHVESIDLMRQSAELTITYRVER